MTHRTAYAGIAVAAAGFLTLLATSTLLETGESYAHAIVRTCGERADTPCVLAYVADAAKSQSVKKAFDALEDWYESSPPFRPKCHYLTTKLGESHYEIDKDGLSLPLFPRSGLCDYGFYHGYVRPFALEHTKEATRDLCARIESALAESLPNIGLECYRSAGQAFPFKESAGKHVEHMTYDAVRACADISPTARHRNFCYSGVFFGVGRSAVKETDGLSIESFEPFELCEKQDTEARPLCYSNLVKEYALSAVPQGTIEDQIEEVQRLFPADSTRTVPELIWVLAYEMARQSMTEEKDAQTLALRCASLPHVYQRDCARGVALAFAKHGTPWKQHAEVLRFCKEATRLMPIDPSSCATTAYVYIRGFYDTPSFASSCEDLWNMLGIRCDDMLSNFAYPENVTGWKGVREE